MVYNYEIGLAVLRTILSFLVIMTHFYDFRKAQGKWKIITEKAIHFHFHVPVFFIMSFYFAYKTFISPNHKKKYERLQRLCIPYFIWPIIIYFLNKLLNKYSIRYKTFKYEDLKIQIVCGIGLGRMNILWTQWTMIFFTIFFNIFIIIF